LKLRVDNPEPASDSLLLLFSLVVVLVIVALILGVYAKRRRSRTATLELRAGPPVDRFSAKKEPSATVCDCPECGVEVSGEETECPNCGANLEGARVDEMERASADSLDRDTRIKVLRDLLERGRISREVYGANLVRLGARDPSSTGTSTDDGELSYLCPICDNEVDAAATECPSCGALFED
ncbi:MAG: hypothetical protein ACE5KV_08205, partial [Thermoplasmata archaeon]